MMITLGDKAYDLRPSFKALLQLEERSNTGLITLAKRFADGSFTLADALAVLRCGVDGAGGSLPVNAGELMLAQGMASLAPVLAAFLHAALTGDADTGKALAASGSTGPSS